MIARIVNRSSALIVFLALAGRAEHAQPAETGHAWSYEEGQRGPAHWGDLKEEYAACKKGTHQSPIDIRGARPADLPAIEFSYAPASFRIVDNGHTVQVSVERGNFIRLRGRRYDLVQFHFHHPSEERIGGQAFTMDVHLVHKDADDKLAVVAVLLKTGKANPFIEALWKNLPGDVGEEHTQA